MDQELEQARIKHLAFKSKLRALLYGAALEDEKVFSETESSLGKWILDKGRQQFAHLSEMLELEKVHNQMHLLVKKMLDLCREGLHDKARDGLPEVEETSERILLLLECIDKRLSQKP